MKSLTIIADENIPGVEALFSHLGHVELVDGRHLNRSQIQSADVLLVRSVSTINEDLLKGSAVKFVGTATIGTDHLDIAYLNSHGIDWSNAPACNANSVVDYVISTFCRLDGVLDVLLAGGSLGIIGMGNVGSRLYKRLSALGVSCKGFDPLINQDNYPILTNLDEVLQCDVVCCHAPLTTEGDFPTFHMFNEARLSSLKSGAILINAGRGAVVDNKALFDILQDRQDLCVVLDVWEGEPDIMLDLLKRVDLATPHIAGYSLDGKLAGTQMIYEACCDSFGVQFNSSKVNASRELQLTISELDDVSPAIKEAVLACYDVAKDDQNLRGILLRADSASRARLFDQIRKNYPERREFSSFTITNYEQLSPSIINGLVAVGFCF